ncbi:SUMF1/EgtB/PvdO family nonheme iron enzyme [Pseudoduganella sp. RAF19]|uniref:SUMF1/EgtB/PvdO family nonheme iron enzyme n=2 Tax=unclassified Pseudoduganella TaxID=2637179 RepID=UPI003F997595
MQTARDKIRELRALHEDGLLSQQEFDRRKNAILDAEYAPPGGSASPAQQRQGTELGLMTGQEIGPQNRRYRLERLIGMGGMGQVWQATDLATHAELGHSELVALKILPPQLTQSPAHAKLLIEEATSARRLAHDNIVRVYEWAQDPATSSYFIIMECLEGQDLDAWLAEHGKATEEEVQRLLHPVADALQYAWDKHKLVHRDLKPGNVFLTKEGEIKLLDFGIASRARNTGSTLGLQTPNAGTAGYRAPEAGTNQGNPRPQLDVYAVAVMIYQMLEGVMPFGEQRAAGVQPKKPDALNELQWQVLQRGFALNPKERPASVTALLDALGGAAGPSEEELAVRAAEEKARLAQEQEQAREAERQRKEEAERQRQEEVQRQLALAEQRKVQAQAAAVEKAKQEQIRRELEKQRRLQAEEEARQRKEKLRQQLIARREADALKARQEEEERHRKLAQLKAEAAYRLEQDRHRKEEAARKAAELAAMTSSSPVADASGVLRDRFQDGTGAGPDLVLIPTGRFQMGSTAFEHSVALKAGSQKTWLDKELPAHWVGIERPFALGRYPVTVREWRQFVRATDWESKLDENWADPGFKQTDEHPVVCVSWNDTQLYLQWLSEKTGQAYRLPTEAEWEYACRAGTHTAFSFGDEISTEHANYDGNFTYHNSVRGEFRGGTTAVGTFQPNPWGLFDMHGNVWEWTQDAVHENYEGAPADGSAWEQGGDAARRILRGGAWLYQPRYLRSGLRNGYSAVLANDVVGFRVVRNLA